jgi:hypothetical protein
VTYAVQRAGSECIRIAPSPEEGAGIRDAVGVHHDDDLGEWMPGEEGRHLRVGERFLPLLWFVPGTVQSDANQHNLCTTSMKFPICQRNVLLTRSSWPKYACCMRRNSDSTNGTRFWCHVAPTISTGGSYLNSTLRCSSMLSRSISWSWGCRCVSCSDGGGEMYEYVPDTVPHPPRSSMGSRTRESRSRSSPTT